MRGKGGERMDKCFNFLCEKGKTGTKNGAKSSPNFILEQKKCNRLLI